MRNQFLIAATALTLLCAACKKDKPTVTNDPSTLQIQYYYTYNAATDSTTIGADLYYIHNNYSTPAYLQFNQSVTFNADTLRSAPYPQPHSLMLTLPGFVPTGTFTFSNDKGRHYPYTMPALVQRALPSTFTTLNRHAADTLWYTGGAVNYNEGVILQVNDTYNQMATLSNYKQAFIYLDSATLKPLAAGTGTAGLCYNSPAGSLTEGAPAGCVIDRRLYTAPRTVTIY